ncbi:MAG TPA: MBL fold metallo-hydrolase [Candidatus Saccharimonadales bacterium]|jgi:L-ascorbate metabolism protein UlaG (beta-lactamase superfamily)|nr:MBL fold metallo-hydrolase [Candidatus Saccharimonadales bacterium]
MELQFHGANCLTLNTKQARVTIDDNLAELGSTPVLKANDIAIFTQQHSVPKEIPKLVVDGPGEYEVSGISIQGMKVRSHIDTEQEKTGNLYKIQVDDLRLVVTGHIYPDLTDTQLETIGTVDILCIPVGGNGYTLDGEGALKLIKKIEPKIVIPTHYADNSLKYPVAQQSLKEALESLGMEPKETLNKLKIKLADLSDVTQLIVLEKA